EFASDMGAMMKPPISLSLNKLLWITAIIGVAICIWLQQKKNHFSDESTTFLTGFGTEMVVGRIHGLDNIVHYIYWKGEGDTTIVRTQLDPSNGTISIDKQWIPPHRMIIGPNRGELKMIEPEPKIVKAIDLLLSPGAATNKDAPAARELLADYW